MVATDVEHGYCLFATVVCMLKGHAGMVGRTKCDIAHGHAVTSHAQTWMPIHHRTSLERVSLHCGGPALPQAASHRREVHRYMHVQRRTQIGSVPVSLLPSRY